MVSSSASILYDLKLISSQEKLLRLKKKPDSSCNYHPGKPKKRASSIRNQPQKLSSQANPEQWNRATGAVETYFTCCRGIDRCMTLDEHAFENFESLAKSLIFEKTPPPSPNEPKRKAVALDCEMGTSITNSSELIQLCAVDYFTGETLIDTLVLPNVEMLHYNTKYSGVTPEMMERAIDEGEYLEGFEGAREELWRWINSETVLIGHSLNHDLWQLRIVHPLIVDSCICVPKLQSSGNSLKNLTLELLGKQVQDGSTGHDCVEDALAARELVIWCSENRAFLEARAELSRVEEEVRRKEREARNLEKEECWRLKLEAREMESSIGTRSNPQISSVLVPRQLGARGTAGGKADVEIPKAHPGQNTWTWQ